MRFRPTSVVVDNKRLRAYEVRCCRCGATSALHINTVQGARSIGDAREEQLITRKFATAGWMLGHNATNDTCPGCVAKASGGLKGSAAILPMMKTTSPPAAPAPPPPDVEAPKPMDREDKRVVYAEVEASYGNGRYLPGHTDKSVAAKLACPQAWVAQIREEFFGDAGSNPEIDDAIAKTQALIGEIGKHVDAMRLMMDEQDKAYAKLLDRGTQLATLSKQASVLTDLAKDNERRLITIQQAVRPGA